MPTMAPTLSAVTRNRAETMSEAELEAYLESVDAMSCLPTPPLTEVSSWDTPWNGPLLDSMSGGNTEVIARRISNSTARVCAGSAACVSTVVGYLKAAHLPIETVALAYNILADLKSDTPCLKRQDSAGPLTVDLVEDVDDGKTKAELFQQPELFVLASLQIATSFMNDQPMKLSSWIDTVAGNSFSLAELKQMNAQIFASLEWHLYKLAQPECVDATLAKFRADRSELEVPEQTRFRPAVSVPELRLDGKVLIEYSLPTPMSPHAFPDFFK